MMAVVTPLLGDFGTLGFCDFVFSIASLESGGGALGSTSSGGATATGSGAGGGTTSITGAEFAGGCCGSILKGNCSMKALAFRAHAFKHVGSLYYRVSR